MFYFQSKNLANPTDFALFTVVNNTHTRLPPREPLGPSGHHPLVIGKLTRHPQLLFSIDGRDPIPLDVTDGTTPVAALEAIATRYGLCMRGYVVYAGPEFVPADLRLLSRFPSGHCLDVRPVAEVAKVAIRVFVDGASTPVRKSLPGDTPVSDVLRHMNRIEPASTFTSGGTRIAATLPISRLPDANLYITTSAMRNYDDEFALVQEFETAHGRRCVVQHRHTRELWHLDEVVGGESSCSGLEEQMRLLQECACPFVIKYYGSRRVSRMGKLAFAMYTQAAEYSALRHADIASWPTAARHVVLLGVASAISFVHARGIVHNSVSLSHVNLTRERWPLLSGFNAAFRIETGPRYEIVESQYTAPEGAGGFPVDVFAFGVLAAEIVSGRGAFAGLPELGRSPYADLVARCCAPDPGDRPSARELVDWLSGGAFSVLLKLALVTDYARAVGIAITVAPPGIPEVRLADFTLVMRFDDRRVAVFEHRDTRVRSVFRECHFAPEEMAEFRSLRLLACQSVAKYRGIAVKEGWLQREYAANGDLLQALYEARDFDATERHIIAFGVAKGLCYLHASGFGHGNLRPSNVLLNERNEPMLVGFTLSRGARLRESFEDRVKDESLCCCAPEVLRTRKAADAAADVFAFGMLLYSLMYDATMELEASEGIGRFLESGQRPSFPEGVELPVLYKILITGCWKQNPEERTRLEKLPELLVKDSFLEYIDCDRFNAYASRF
jgi:serine/threonine protein kinase